MNSTIILLIIISYFGVLMLISHFASKNTSDDSFYTGDRKSPWQVVAFGMIGAVMSGVTFVSIPGMVSNNYFYYLQFVFGNVVGYIFITYVLIPIYYNLQLVSIYSYLETRFGPRTYKTGSLFFLISQSFGAALRLLLAAKILQYAVFDALNIPFFLTVIIILILIWMYTNKSGIKTIVWTDTLQTFFLLLAAVVSIYIIKDSLNLSFSETITSVTNHKYFKVFNWDFNSGSNFFKQFISGILIAVAMVGLDQNMMQKTLTCKSKKEAQRNILTFSLFLALAQFLFLGLGVMLYLYAEKFGIQLEIENGQFIHTDNLFPMLSLGSFGTVAAISFILGITAASFSSVDSSLTALTTSFTHDFLDITHKNSKEKKRLKNYVLLAFSIVIFIIIMLFSGSKGDVITTIFKVAGYTYGPLLGLYLLGIFTKIKIKDTAVPYVCVLMPLLTYYINYIVKVKFSFDLGFMNILLNACLTILCLILIRNKNDE
ncbi:sodium:solute symporter [Polaribacter sp. R2A056_3_33]|uniref:sodium:solute symporter n=1 Tax=unclassified Polaribacter TaxID=196858 RepID=UPI001C4E32E4|nr:MULTISPECIES: sodium:solute symporter [unclassified Polaribacter]QXP64017.1 sodium:solute symporter [Polaribacter sp. HaHaR_3_91]QXP71996.1 sodium:solute symporter [Polaribacter sp. R2A056_3_33]